MAKVEKKIEGELEPVDLWSQHVDKVTLRDFVKNTINVEKIIWFGASNSGKTHAYLSILRDYAKRKIPAKNVCMCIVFPDRATGITKLWHLVPKEYQDCIYLYAVHNYEGLVTATANAEKVLMEHFEKTKTHGWLIVELLEEAWRMSQDYYSRKAFGETLADLLAVKRQAVAELMKSKDKEGKDTAYQALEGYKDWVVIKFFHNFNWIDRIKKMPFNVGATCEVKTGDDEDEIFSAIKVRPAGEKDNVHRFDTVLYLKHQGNNFYQRCFKLTGYSRVYTDVDITNKDGYTIHREITEKFDKSGYKTSKYEEIEQEAGIIPPQQEEPKEKKPKKEKVKDEDFDLDIEEETEETKEEPTTKTKEKTEKPKETKTKKEETKKEEHKEETKKTKEEIDDNDWEDFDL